MSKTISVTVEQSGSEQDYRDLYSGFIRLHVLHHAALEKVFGLGLIEELRRHGYRISPGSLYPMLHSMEERGYLRSTVAVDGRSRRKEYSATPVGKRALRVAKKRINELFRELVEEAK